MIYTHPPIDYGADHNGVTKKYGGRWSHLATDVRWAIPVSTEWSTTMTPPQPIPSNARWVFALSPDGVKVIMRGLVGEVTWDEIVECCEKHGCASDAVLFMSEEQARGDATLLAVIENHLTRIGVRMARIDSRWNQDDIGRYRDEQGSE